VPLVADFTITHPGQPTVYGKFFRSSNGSRRIESGPSAGDSRVISIENLSTLIGYIYNASSNQWKMFSLANPEAQVQPPRFRKNPTWSLHPAKLAVRVGESGSLEATEGLEAYRAVDGAGTVTFKVPQLNFFAVVSMRPDGR
jgi:hypothetical protein